MRVDPTPFFRAAAVAGALLIAGASRSDAGAWTAKSGHFYDRLSLNGYQATHDFDRDGERASSAAGSTFTDVNLTNYFEFGLTDSLTVLNSLVYKRICNDTDLAKTTTTGVGDVDVGLRYKLLENQVGVFALQGLVKIPDAYDKNETLPLGNGQYDVEGKLLYGRSLYPLLPAYAGLEVGYRWRADAPSDELRYLVELGGDFTSKLYGRVKLDGLYSLDNGKRRDTSGNPTTQNNFDLAKLDVTLGYKLGAGWGLEAAYTPAVYGQNTAAGSTYTLALFYATP